MSINLKRNFDMRTTIHRMKLDAGTSGESVARGNAARVPPDDDMRDRQFVVALARGLEVLRAFSLGDGLLGNQEIAARTGLPKPTVSRLTHTLTKLGYLAYSERLGKYELGTGVLALGYAALRNIGVGRVARPFMQALADYSGASVSLGSRDRLEMVYIEHCRSNATVSLRLETGSRIPLGMTAMGRAFLAASPNHERETLMERLRAAHGNDWPRVAAGIAQAIEDYRTHGYTLSIGDWKQDVHAVAVPLVPPDRSRTLAINCGGPSFLFDRDRLTTDLGPRLVKLVQNIEAALMNVEQRPDQRSMQTPRG
jgi:DNA-binding IclR family transcriptional regulator